MDLSKMAKNIDAGFWNGKRVLITGHTGFKGSWLSIWLQSMGSVLRGAALKPATAPSMFEIANVEKGIESCILDIREFSKVRECIADFQPEIIFHMAAQPLVRLSYNQPIDTYATNVMGTVHVLEAARSVDCVKAIVNVTTDKCYENREWVWGYREDEPMGGHDPYSASKACSELVTSSYRKSFFDLTRSGLATARAGNVIGGGDWSKDRLIPDLITNLQNNQSTQIRNPRATRPWQHVLEPLSGYMMLAEQLYNKPKHFSEAWNFGPEDADVKQVDWIANKICALWGNDAQWETDQELHVHEANWLKLDITKAKYQLGWQPKWTINEALEHTVEWYSEFMFGSNMSEFTEKQIKLYMKD